MSKKEIDMLVKSNPEPVLLHIRSEHSKLGFFKIELPKAFVENGIDVSIPIPKEALVDETKKGKIGSYQIKQKGDWKNLRLPTYATITLYVEETK